MRKDQCSALSVGPRIKSGDCARMLCIRACFVSLSFAGLVVLARSLNPIPSRTRPLNSSAPMVLWLKPWESRSLPDLPRTRHFLFTCHDQTKRRFPSGRRRFCFGRNNLRRIDPSRCSGRRCDMIEHDHSALQVAKHLSHFCGTLSTVRRFCTMSRFSR